MCSWPKLTRTAYCHELRNDVYWVVRLRCLPHVPTALPGNVGLAHGLRHRLPVLRNPRRHRDPKRHPRFCPKTWFLGKRVKPESSKNEIHPTPLTVRRDSQRGWKWQLSNLLRCFLVSCKMIMILILMGSQSPNPKADAITPSKEKEHISYDEEFVNGQKTAQAAPVLVHLASISG